MKTLLSVLGALFVLFIFSVVIDNNTVKGEPKMGCKRVVEAYRQVVVVSDKMHGQYLQRCEDYLDDRAVRYTYISTPRYKPATYQWEQAFGITGGGILGGPFAPKECMYDAQGNYQKPAALAFCEMGVANGIMHFW